MSRVKIRNIKRQDYKRTTRLWGSCPSCGCTWQWNGHTANAADGETFIRESACMCAWPHGGRITPPPTASSSP